MIHYILLIMYSNYDYTNVLLIREGSIYFNMQIYISYTGRTLNFGNKLLYLCVMGVILFLCFV